MEMIKMPLNHIGTQPIQTERLLLRRFEHDDSHSAFAHWAGDPLVQPMYAEPVYASEEAVKELLHRYISGYSQSSCYRWAITPLGGNNCIGQIAYFLLDDKNHFAEIEYCISRAHQNQGLVTEAVRAVMQFGFAQINLHKVQVCHRPDNPASRRVIKKCGFRYEGTLRDYFHVDGKYFDRLYYSVLHSEWKAS